jgi:hypothetical protein
MKINATKKQVGTRLGLAGGLAIGIGAMLIVTSTTAASVRPAHEASLPRGVEQQISKLQYAQTIEEAKQDITQAQSLYGLLFNGNGPKGPDRVAWGKDIFVGNGPFNAYDANLQLIPSQSFAHMKDEIAGAVATQPTTWPNTANANGSMHYMFAPVFDSITATTAVTDTPSMSVNAVKGSQVVNTLTIRVYHDTWVKTKDTSVDGGWRKTTSTWYRLD